MIKQREIKARKSKFIAGLSITLYQIFAFLPWGLVVICQEYTFEIQIYLW